MCRTAKQTRSRARRVRLKRDVEAKPGDLAEAPGVGHTLVEPGPRHAGGRSPSRGGHGRRPRAALIRDDYLNATPELVALRAVDEEGFVTLLSEAIGIARMYLDYSPLLHWKADMDALQLAVAAGMTGRSLPPPEDVQAAEERAVEPLVEAMGISRAEAKRYVAMAKRVEDEGRSGS